jgi:hypothetical protein
LGKYQLSYPLKGGWPDATDSEKVFRFDEKAIPAPVLNNPSSKSGTDSRE